MGRNKKSLGAADSRQSNRPKKSKLPPVLPHARTVLSEAAKETQQCELVSLDAMFPGAVKVLHPGFLTAKDIAINHLTEAPAILEAGSAAWHIPEPADIDDERETLITLRANGDTKPSNDNFLQYRILFLKEEGGGITDLLESGVKLTGATPRFVLGVSCPPKYPPRPPLVILYSNIPMTGARQKSLQAVALATLLDSHPLFPERIIPLCEVILTHLREAVGGTPAESPSVEQFGNSAPDQESQATDRQMDTESILAVKSRRLHADVLRGLGHEEFASDDGATSPSRTVLSSTSSKATPISTSLGEGENGSASPFFYPARHRNPLDFYILARDRQGHQRLLTEEETAARGVTGRKYRRHFANRRKATAPLHPSGAVSTGLAASSPTGTSTGARETPAATAGGVPLSEFIPKGPAASQQQQRETRLLADYDSFAPITTIGSSRWCVRLQARNKVDRCWYEIQIYRTEALCKYLLKGPHSAASRDQLVARLISDVQSYSHMDQPHLQRVQSVWTEPLKGHFVSPFLAPGGGSSSFAKFTPPTSIDGKKPSAIDLALPASSFDFSGATNSFSAQSLMDLIANFNAHSVTSAGSDSEMCVLVQAEFIKNLVDLNGGNEETRKLLTKDNLMPARIAQQMLEALAFLHSRAFVHLGNLRTAGLEIDDWGVKVKLRVPEFLAPFFLMGPSPAAGGAAGIPPSALGSLRNLPDLHRAETAVPLSRALEPGMGACQVLELSTDHIRCTRQHQVLCQARCRSLSSSCPLLQKIDLCLFCSFFMDLIRIANDSNALPNWTEDKSSISKTYRKFESLAHSPLPEMPSALELLQDQAVFKPLVSREALKDLLMQLGNPSGPDSLAVVERLFDQPANLSSGSFLFHSQEASLNRTWEDFIPSLAEQWAQAIEELLTRSPSAEEDSTGRDDELVQQFAEAESSLHFVTYTDSLSLSSVLYKDLYTLQLFESMLDRLCCVQLDLPTLVPLRPIPMPIEAPPLGHNSAVQQRWLSALQQSTFVGALPSEPPTMYLNKGNFLTTCPRSLTHCITSLLQSSPELISEQAASRLSSQNSFVSLQPVHRPSGQCGYPLSSLRALYCAWNKYDDFPDLPDDPGHPDAGGGYSAQQLLPFWFQAFTAANAMLAPFHRALRQYRVIVSFPTLLEQLLLYVAADTQTITSPQRSLALRRAAALAFFSDVDLGDAPPSMLVMDSVRLSVLRGFSEYGAMNAKETLEGLDQVADGMASAGARAVISDLARAICECHTFLSQPGALGPSCTVLFDLFAPPAWVSPFYPQSQATSEAATTQPSSEGLRSSPSAATMQVGMSFAVYRSVAVIRGDEGSLEECKEVSSSLHAPATCLNALMAVGGMIFDGQHGPVTLVEASIELMSRVANHAESEIYALEGAAGLAILSHARTPQVLVVMQTWSTCEAAVVLAGKLQLLGIQADWRARPVVNLQHIRRELPANCSALLHVVFIKNVGGSKGVVYKVESLGSHHARGETGRLRSDGSTDQTWSSQVFESESAVVSFILGQVARTKSQVRSAVVRDCQKRIKAVA